MAIKGSFFKHGVGIILPCISCFASTTRASSLLVSAFLVYFASFSKTKPPQNKDCEMSGNVEKDRHVIIIDELCLALI